MRRLAVFVEGQTEVLFLRRILEVVATQSSVTIHTLKLAGKSGKTELMTVELAQGNDLVTHYVLLIDCGTDAQVKSAIRERYDGLAQQGYELIIGVRDVYPDFTFAQVAQLRSGLASNLLQQPTRVVFVLGIMEVEAWFLAEHTHYSRIHANLTVARIREELGFDVVADDLQRRPHPAKDLGEAYWLEKMVYDKSRERALRTIQALDFDHLKLQLSKQFPDLGVLLIEMQKFIGNSDPAL